MSVTIALRMAVRERFDGRCGYCGVSETAVGNELDVDHFRPRVHGGASTLENLIYTCPACNRYKSDYWPTPDAPDDQQLLHPYDDDLSAHIVETISGRLVGLTTRGWFHIRWLHLNRPLLIQIRQLRQRELLRDRALVDAQVVAADLKRRVQVLEQELDAVRRLLEELIRSQE